MDNFKRCFSHYLDFFAPSDSRLSNSYISAKYCPDKPYIHGKLIYSALRCTNLNVEKLTLITGFVVQVPKVKFDTKKSIIFLKLKCKTYYNVYIKKKKIKKPVDTCVRVRVRVRVRV